MKVQVKANIQLTQQDLEQAIRDYVTANGFDLTDKEVEFSELPEGLDILVNDDLTESTAQAERPAPAKRRSPAKKAEPKVAYPDPKDPDEVPEVAAQEEEPVAVESKPQRTAEEIKASIAEKEAEFLAKPKKANPFDDEPEVQEEDSFKPETMLTNDDEQPDEDDELVEAEPVPGETTDNSVFAEEETPVKRSKSIFDDEDNAAEAAPQKKGSIFDEPAFETKKPTKSIFED